MSDVLEDLVAGAIAVFAVVVLLGGLFMGALGVSWHGDHVSCLRLSEQTGYQTRMSGTMMFGGECYVNVDGRWIPESRYRMVDTEN